MTNHWVYNWVQVMGHHKKIVIGLFSCIYALLVSSLFVNLDWLAASQQNNLLWDALEFQKSSLLSSPAILVLLSSIVMSVFFAWQSESMKSGVMNFIFLFVAATLTIGVSHWLGVQWGQFEWFGLIVVLTLVTANFVHLLSTLHREMARGLFQFDAVAESLRINHSPILLSNITTALGVICAGWLIPAFQSLAWVVVIGTCVSYFMVITLFPWLFLNWLLEFRVGNSRDRKSFVDWSDWLVQLQSNKLYFQIIIWIAFLMLAFSMILALGSTKLATTFWQKEFFLVLSGFLLILFTMLWFVWQKTSWAWIVTVGVFIVGALAGSVTLIVFSYIDILPAGSDFATSSEAASLWLLVALLPLGVAVDDLIHFFARIHRARMTVFAGTQSSVKAALRSVGRAILVTTIAVILAMLVIVVLGDTGSAMIAVNTIFCLLIMSIFVLFFVPLLLLSGVKH